MAVNAINNNLNQLEREFHNISIRVSHSSRTGTPGDMSFTLRDFITNLEDYIKSARNFERTKYEPLYVSLIRYRELADVRPYIPETLRVSAVLYRRIRDLTRKIVWTRSYYNSLMAINPNNLMTGKTLQDSWEKEFETDVVTKVDTGLNYICEDIDRVNADKLYNKYQALAQRYNFYCYFKRIKQGTSSPSWSDSKAHDYATVFTRGFRDYARRAIVQNDLRENSRYDGNRHEEPWYKGPRGAYFIGGNSNSNERIYWFETGYKDTNGSTLGKKIYHWQYKGAGSRRLQVFLNLRFLDMSPDKYPFVGLD